MKRLTLFILIILGVFFYCYSGDEIPQPSVNMSNGGYIMSGVVITHDITVPSGVTFTGGYITPEGQYISGITTTVDTLLKTGTEIIGDLVFPNGTVIPPHNLLPGGTIIGKTTSPTIFSSGAIIPPNSTLTPSLLSSKSSIPNSSIILGSIEKLKGAMTFPVNTTFVNGYINSNGDIFQGVLSLDPGIIHIGIGILTALEPITVDIGGLIHGGSILPNNSKMLLPANLTGGIVIPMDSIEPGEGIILPIGSEIPNGITYAKGTALMESVTFPVNSVFEGGYIDTAGSFIQQTTLTTQLTLPKDTILLGNVSLPSGKLSTATPIYGGARYRNTLNSSSSLLGSAIIPANATISAGSVLPNGTLIAGSTKPLQNSITFPAGTEFLGGYKKANGDIVDPFVSTVAITLNSGDTLQVGAIINSTTGMALASDTAFESVISFTSCAVQPATGNMTLPVGTIIPYGVTEASGSISISPTFSPIGTSMIVSADSKYYIDLSIISIAVVSGNDTAEVRWYTNLPSSGDVMLGTNSTLTTYTTFTGTTNTSTHVVTATGLLPDTVYYFQVVSAGGASACSGSSTIIYPSSPLSFKTAPTGAGDGWELVVVANDPNPTDIALFGDAHNIEDIGMFNSRIYFAGGGPNDGTTKVRLYASDSDLMRIMKPQVALNNSSYQYISKLSSANFDGTSYLYLGIVSSQPFGVVRSTDGSNFDILCDGAVGGGTDPTKGGFGDGDNLKVSSLFGLISSTTTGYIYLGTNNVNIGGKLYLANASGTASDFNNPRGIVGTYKDGSGDIFNGSQINSNAADPQLIQGPQVSSVNIFNSNLYVGVLSGSTATLFRTPDVGIKSATAPTWSSVSITGFDTNDKDMKVLSSFGSKLYVATTNPNGAKIYSTANGTTWNKLVDFATGTGIGGTAKPNNYSINFVVPYGTSSNNIYFGTTNTNSGCEIWQSTDGGTSFTMVGTNGFGLPEFIDARVGFSTAIVSGVTQKITYVAFVDKLTSDGKTRVYRKVE